MDFAGTVGAVNKVLQLSIDVSESFKHTGFPVERALDIVGRGNLPQVRWFLHAYATVSNITSAILDAVDQEMTRLIPVALCNLSRWHLDSMLIIFTLLESSSTMDSKNVFNAASS